MIQLIALALQLAPETVHSGGNPILADGRTYSTDPAPLVDGDTLWILAGRDEAPDGVNDFIMNEWQLLSTRNPASGVWRHHPAIARPERVFAWAEPGRAYAGQIVKARDGRFYMYAPVLQRDGDAKDRFAIGVAVADRPTGPWRDAHPSGPIISQTVPVANDIQNIDPTVLIDDAKGGDGRVYIYWGTFGRLRAMELAPDMVTPKGPRAGRDRRDRLFRGAVAPEAARHLLSALRREQYRTRQPLHPDAVPCLPGLCLGAFADGTMDLSRRGAAPGVLDHLACRRGGVQRPLVSDLSHGRREGRGAFPPLGRDRSDGLGRQRLAPRHPPHPADQGAHASRRPDPQCGFNRLAHRLQRPRPEAILDRRAKRRQSPQRPTATRHVGQLDEAEPGQRLDRISLAPAGDAERGPHPLLRRPPGRLG